LEQLKLSGPMREKCDEEIARSVFQVTLGSSAVFCIELIIDWLYLAGVYKGDPYQYRFNVPGTVTDKNWSMTIPLSLEELLKHKVNQEIKELIISSGDSRYHTKNINYDILLGKIGLDILTKQSIILFV